MSLSMKTVIQALLLIGLTFGAVFSSVAGPTYRSAGTTYKNSGGSSYYSGSSGTVSGGVSSVTETVNVGGVYVPVPYVGPITAAAAEAIVAGLKRTPGIATAAVLAWVMQKGLELIEGEWKKPGDVVEPQQVSEECDAAFATWSAGHPGFCGGSAFCDHWYDGSYCRISWGDTLAGARDHVLAQFVVGGQQKCPEGYSPVTIEGSPACASPYVPATESDWAKFRGEIPPDQVLNDLCKQLVAMGSTAPGCAVSSVKGTAGIGVLSDWVADPNNSNVETRQIVKVTPSPSADDPERVSVSTETQTQTTTTSPDGSTSTSSSSSSDSDTDFCVLHPESLACVTLGEPGESPPLGTKDISVSLAPDSGFGPSTGTCPADRAYTTRYGGVPVVMSWAPVCQAATTFRPVVIGMAWLSAVLIFMGITKRSAS